MNKSITLVDAATLRPSATIADALKLVGDRYGAIIAVTDDFGRLLGVVSAGDLRKNILNGHMVSASLSDVMNTQPVIIRQSQLDAGADVTELQELLKPLYDFESMMYAMVPVVDDNNRIQGLANFQSLEVQTINPEVNFGGRKVLVVGGAGFIGSALTRMLVAEGWWVNILDSFLYGQNSLAKLESNKVSILKGDVRNIDTVVEAVEEVDAVVYLAELVGDPAVAQAPQMALKTNYLAVTTLANLCAYLNINRFVYTSSCSVYGASEDPESLLNERSPTAPISLYGKIKLMVEEAVLTTAKLPNPQFSPTILRLATAFGYSDRCRFDLVVNTFVKEAFTKGKIELFGGNQWRPQVHIKDISQAIMRVLDAPLDTVRSQIFNVGSTRNNHTINQLGNIALELFPDLEVIRNDAKADVRNYRVDFDKIQDRLCFEAVYSVKDGMAELKQALESGAISDPDDIKYSNYKSIQELAII